MTAVAGTPVLAEAVPEGAIRPIEAPTAAIRNVRSTSSTYDTQSFATNVRDPPQPCEASVDWHSYVVS